MTATIQINGEQQDLAAATIFDLLRGQDIDPNAKGVAVALNGRVVPRGSWPSTAVAEGDEIEIVKPFAGG
jgi:sulfur carrier protein